jgi:hypothetical protein
MHSVVRHHALRVIVVVTARIQVAVKARKIAARNLNANAAAGGGQVTLRSVMEARHF